MSGEAMTVIWILVIVLFVAGLIGALVPLVPGVPLILIGAAIYAIATDWTVIGPGRLAVLGALAALAMLLDYVAGALGVRRYGGSRWGMVGAVAGALIGLTFGPLGLVLGPVVGAVAGELVAGRPLADSVRSGLGAVVGFLAGTVASFALALVMIGLFAWWVWRPSG